MNRLVKKLFNRNNVMRNVTISIVILLELVILLTVTTYSWVETVSSIKIKNPQDGTVDTYVYTNATIGETETTINLGDYFKKSGDMHLAPASSANGLDLFFPKTYGTDGVAATSVTDQYRKASSSDKNTTYLSVAIKVKLDPNVYSGVDFYFENGSNSVNFGSSYLNDNVRVSVTEKTVGSNDSPITKIYGKTASDAEVVNAINGATGATHVESFTSHTKEAQGDNAPLFTLENNSQSKVIIINIWLQKSDGDLTDSLNANVDISDLVITSSLTPRHVTLIPGTSWEAPAGSTWHYYAWCYTRTGQTDSGSKLFELEKDNDTGYYGFDYIGSFNTMNFIVAESDIGDTGDTSWPTGLKKQSVDTSVPDTPIDPYCFITSYSDGASSRSTVTWEIPATVKTAVVSGQGSWGSVHEVYNDKLQKINNVYNVHTSNTGTSAMVYSFGSNSSVTSAYKKVNIIAEPTPNAQNPDLPHYAFVGWYSDISGLTPASGTGMTSSSVEVTSPNKGLESTYYAKFKEVRTIKLVQLVDGSNVTGGGTISVNAQAAADTATASALVDYNTSGSVALTATPKPGYTLQGIFSQQTGGQRIDTDTAGSASVIPDNDKVYYARFTTNSYTVTANAYYSTDNGSTYSAGSNGGTVQIDSETTGAVSSKLILYKTTATLKAVADSDYVFVGWYDGTGSGAERLSQSATYTYTLNTADDVNVYARFRLNKFNVTANAMYSSDGSTYTAGSTGGTVTAGASAAGATSTARVSYTSTVSLVATPDTDYSFVGWYDSGNNELSTSASYTYTLNTYGNVNVNARFRLKKFTVTAKAAYSSDGTDYTVGGTGGTVKAGDSDAGATSAAYAKTNGSAVSLVATAKSGYDFVGWYSSSGTQLSPNTTYSYTLSVYSNVDVFARFRVNTFTVTANAYYKALGQDAYTAGATGGTVTVGTSEAGATSADTVQKGNTIALVATPAPCYKFDGWFAASSGGTALSASTTYNYPLNSYANASVYARFSEVDHLYVKTSQDWDSTDYLMVPSSATGYSFTIPDVPEGGFEFKIYNATTNSWYGKGTNGSKTTITETGSAELATETENLIFLAHAGSYTFNYNKTTNTVSVSRNSYNNITITFDYSGFHDAGKDSASFYFYSDNQADARMSDGDTYTRTISIPSNRGNSNSGSTTDTVGFKRKNSAGTSDWNTWNAGNRGYKTTYKASGWGTGSWE